MTPAELAQAYLGLGLQPIPLPFKSKKPTLDGWSKLIVTKEALPQYFNGASQNIGGLLGAASGHLVDIDLDWPEAVELAQHLLPRSWRFGRGGQVRHVLFRAAGVSTARFDAPVSLSLENGGRRIIEVLSDGAQVMLPGSVHPDTGETIEWLTPPDQAPVTLTAEQLLSRVQAIAGAALLVRLWPDLEGTRHDVTLSLAGALHHAGWPESRIQVLLVAVLSVAKDSERRDRAKAVHDTLRAAAVGRPVTGLPRLAELLAADVMATLTKWWSLGTAAGLGLTIGGQPMTVGNAGPPVIVGQVGQYPPITQSWPDLLEFERDLQPNTAAYPLQYLGPLLAGAVKSLVDRQQVPVALAAQSVLAASSATTQAYFDVELDGRVLPLSLWLVLVGEPGERKTSTDDRAFERVVMRMQEAQLRYRVALSGWKSAKKEGDPGPRPRNPTTLLRDATSEGLLKTLDRHWPALTLTNSDAAAWLAGYSMREGRDSSTAATLSSLWSGTFHSQARASLDEPSTLHGRRLSLSLMMQPEMAAKLFDSRTLAGQGFLSRCLPAFPASTIGQRPYRRAEDDPRLTAFYNAQDALLLQPATMDLDGGELQPKRLVLTHEALQAWIRHHDHFEAELVGLYAPIRETANKSAEQLVRLAGVRAAMEGRAEIDVEQIEDAAALVHWYNAEWLAMAGRLVAHRREVTEPAQLLDWMRQHRRETGNSAFNLRNIYRSGPRLVRNQADHARTLMSELLRRGYVRMAGRDFELRPEEEL